MSDSHVSPIDVAVRSCLERQPLPGLVCAYLFGSEASGRAHRESDVDVGILVRWDVFPTTRDRFEARVRLASQLEEALGRAVDVVVLNDAPPVLARRVVVEGRRLLCTDAEVEHAFVRDVQLRAADLLPWLRRMSRLKLDAIRR